MSNYVWGYRSALDQYMYSDATHPVLSSDFGVGNYSNGRVNFGNPTGKRILIDGGSGNVGNYYHVTDFAAARAIFAKGDWVLFQANTTTTVAPGNLYTGTIFMGGTSLGVMAVIGTFDPAHNSNAAGDEAYYNTKRATIDLSASAAFAQMFYYANAANDLPKYLAFVNLNMVSDNDSQPCSIDIYGAGDGLYFENCTRMGVTINIQGQTSGTIKYSDNVITSLTSSGTTATALTTDTGILQIGSRVGITTYSGAGSGIYVTQLTSVSTTATALTSSTAGLVVGGKVKMTLADQTEYNGVFTVTAVNANVSFAYTFAGSATPTATWNNSVYNGFVWYQVYEGLYTITALTTNTSFQYTFPGNNNTAAVAQAGGALCWNLVAEDLSTTLYAKHFEERFCGSAYCNDAAGGHTGSSFTAFVDGPRSVYCVHFANGRPRNANRNQVAHGDTGLAVTSITSVGTVATVLLTNTGSLAINDWISVSGASPSAYNGFVQITALTVNTSFTYTFAGGTSPATGTIKVGAEVTPPGAGPDYLKHTYYWDDSNRNAEVMNTIVAWDPCNIKMTGQGFRAQNIVEWRNPKGMIVSAAGNNIYANPSGMLVDVRNHLSIFSDDCNDYAAGVLGGFGPTIYGCITGSYFSGVLVTNDTFRGGAKRGFSAYSNGMYFINTRLTVDSSVIYNWTDFSHLYDYDPYTVVTYTNNVWPLATSGSNTIYSSMPAQYQTNLASMQAKTVFTFLNAFPAYFGSVTQVTTAGSTFGNTHQTEQNMFEYMVQNMIPDGQSQTPNPWCAMVHYHWNGALAGH